MIRIGRLTDYGVVILAHMAKKPDKLFQARSIAEDTAVSCPTVSKLLKKLTKNKLLHSHRGSQGGYQLAFKPHELSISHLIQILEGPIALTDCSLEKSLCPIETNCSLKSPWAKINRILKDTLSHVTLADLLLNKSAVKSPIQPASTRSHDNSKNQQSEDLAPNLKPNLNSNLDPKQTAKQLSIHLIGN